MGLACSTTGQRHELCAERLIQRGIEETLLHYGNVGAGALVHAQPFVLERAGETDQGDKCADGHADSAERQQGPETPAPEVLP